MYKMVHGALGLALFDCVTAGPWPGHNLNGHHSSWEGHGFARIWLAITIPWGGHGKAITRPRCYDSPFAACSPKALRRLNICWSVAVHAIIAGPDVVAKSEIATERNGGVRKKFHPQT